MDKNNEREKKELLEKAFFSYVGYYYTQNILEELEKHREEIDAFEVSEELDKRVYKSIQEIENNRKSKFKKTYDKMLRTKAHKAAAIFIILAVSMAVLTVTVEAFRVRVFNMILEQREKYLEIRLDEEDTGGVNEENLGAYYVPEYIPEGYSIDSVDEYGEIKVIIYSNADNDTIIFNQASNNTKHQFDSENAKKEEININEQKGILLLKQKEATVFWNNEEKSFYLLSDNIEFQELIKMAESIKKNK